MKIRIKQHRYAIHWFAVICWMLLLACSKGNNTQPSLVINNDSVPQKPPAFTGRLVFHRYSCYGCNDSQLFLYNFLTNSLNEISLGWDSIQNSMNAHFSPDGKQLVFMGTPSATNNWDIFLWDINSPNPPRNLTAHLGSASDDE